MHVRFGVVCLTLLASAMSPVVSGMEPVLLSRVEPVYPRSRLELAQDGHASVVFDVDENGRVTNVKLDDATEVEFGQSAIAALRQWRFKPAEENGKAVPTRGLMEEIDILPPLDRKLTAFLGRPAFIDLKGPVVDKEALTQAPALSYTADLRIPDGLRKMASQARVRISFVIDTRGLPVNPKVESTTDERFNFEALITAMTAFWTAGAINGQPANVRWEQTMDFSTAKEKPGPAAQSRESALREGVGGDQRPVLLVRFNPPYPFEMKKAGIQGRVVVGFRVTKRGDVADVYVVSSTDRGFENAAMLAVSHWKFIPGFRNSEAVSTRMQNPISFRLAPAN